MREHPGSYYSLLLMTVARLIAIAWLPLGHWFRSTGSERVPSTGGVILAANHTSYLDPILVAYPLPHRRVFFLAWHLLFSWGWFARLIRGMGAISLDTDKRSDRAAFQTTLGLLKDNEAVCIFPEGVRGWDGGIYVLQPGVARMAVAADVPIVPVLITGAIKAWPRWRALPRLFVPLRVDYLEPIHPAPTRTPAERKAEAERLLKALDAALRSAQARR